MLNLKKVIASICTVALTLSSVAMAASYTDVAEDSAYYEAVETLSKLGIVTGYEDGTYKPEEVVTRAEMAALIARIQGYEETAKGNANTVFTDVPSTHWASGYIAQATNQGIINGYGDGTFGPEDPVLYEQAVKMIMATLGYTPYAVNNGDYPTGYLAAASRYEVVKGVSNTVIGSGANRGTIAQLLSNAIDTPLMAQSKWSTDGTVEYLVYDGISEVYRTLMSENLGVVKLKGILTANTVTDITADKTIDTAEAPEVTITVTDNFNTNNDDFASYYNNQGVLSGYGEDGKYTFDFLVGESDAEDYLGMAVVFYVVDNAEEDAYEIISIAADSTKNDILTFTLDQFDVVEVVPNARQYDSTGKVTGYSGTDGTIRYFKNETDKTSTKKTLDKNVDVVYNGVGGWYIEDILSDSTNAGYITNNGSSLFGGQVTMIDNDTVTGYDVVIVEVAATAVVKKVSEDGTISFKKGAKLADTDEISEIVVDVEDEETVVAIVKDGEVIDYTELVEWDVLSVLAADADAEYIVAEVISNPVVGTITADYTSKTSVGGKGFKIDGNKYDVAFNAYDATNLAVGDGGTFYIDKYGKIAAFNEDAALASGVAGNYGYVYKAIVDTDPIDGDVTTLQIVTANGIEVLDLATSVKYNKADGSEVTLKPSSTATADTAAITSFIADVYGGGSKRCVIKYTKNSSGKINNITMANHGEKFETAATPSGLNEFDADNAKVGSTYIDSDAVIFFIDQTDVDKCAVGTLADLEDQTKYELLAVYTDSKATDNNIIVVKGGLNNLSPTSSLAVLTSVANAEDENGDEIYALEYMIDGEEVVADTVAWTDVDSNYNGTTTIPTVGDIVKVRLDSAGKVNALKFVWNFNEGVRSGYAAPAEVGTGLASSTDEKFDGGVVKSYKDTSEEVTFSNNKSYKLSRAENVYVIDATGRNVTVKNGSSTSYKYYEGLYAKDASNNNYSVDVINSDTKAVIDTITTNDLTEIKKYTDFVYVRTFEEKVKDVVIVKGANNVRVSVNTGSSVVANFTVDFNLNGATGTAPADQTVANGSKATAPDATAMGAITAPANKAFDFWGAAADATTAFDFANTTITADTTLYAIWKDATPAPTAVEEVEEVVVDVVEEVVEEVVE